MKTTKIYTHVNTEEVLIKKEAINEIQKAISHSQRNNDFFARDDVKEYMTPNNINTPFNNERWRLIFVASYDGRLDLVKKIVEELGADVNVLNNSNETPIQVASLKGYLEVVKYLHQMGADVDIPSNLSHTPIFNASIKNHLEVVKYLHEVGADANKKNFAGNSPISIAISYGYLDIVKYLSQVCDIKHVNNHGDGLLHTACLYDRLDIAKYLIEELDFDVNMKNNNGNLCTQILRINDTTRYIKTKL